MQVKRSLHHYGPAFACRRVSEPISIVGKCKIDSLPPTLLVGLDRIEALCDQYRQAFSLRAGVVGVQGDPYLPMV